MHSTSNFTISSLNHLASMWKIDPLTDVLGLGAGTFGVFNYSTYGRLLKSIIFSFKKKYFLMLILPLRQFKLCYHPLNPLS